MMDQKQILVSPTNARLLREARAKLSLVLMLQDWAAHDAPKIMLAYSRARTRT